MWLDVKFKDFTIKRFVELGGIPKAKEEPRGEVTEILPESNYSTVSAPVVLPEIQLNNADTLQDLPL